MDGLVDVQFQRSCLSYTHMQLQRRFHTVHVRRGMTEGVSDVCNVICMADGSVVARKVEHFSTF